MDSGGGHDGSAPPQPPHAAEEAQVNKYGILYPLPSLVCCRYLMLGLFCFVFLQKSAQDAARAARRGRAAVPRPGIRMFVSFCSLRAFKPSLRR